MHVMHTVPMDIDDLKNYLFIAQTVLPDIPLWLFITSAIGEFIIFLCDSNSKNARNNSQLKGLPHLELSQHI